MIGVVWVGAPCATALRAVQAVESALADKSSETVVSTELPALRSSARGLPTARRGHEPSISNLQSQISDRVLRVPHLVFEVGER